MTIHAPKMSAPLALSFAFAMTGFAAFASGGSSSGSEPAAKPSQGSQSSETKSDMTTCPKGQVYDVKTSKCLQQKSGILPDGQLVEYAFALDKAKRFDEALTTLDLLQDQNTARALNYRGYTLRKMGRWDEGVAFYQKSIAVDPQYAQVREYLGEAHLEKGDVAKAKEQLATIARICGNHACEEYRDLAKAIKGIPDES